MLLVLAVAVDGGVDLQAYGLDVCALGHAEGGALHPVVVAAVERVLVDVPERDVELVYVVASGQSHGVLLLRSPVLEHELAPVGVVVVEQVGAVAHGLNGLVGIDGVGLAVH